MMLRRICKETKHLSLSKRCFHQTKLPKKYPTSQDWFNFIISSTNCVIIASILWGFESYNEKLKMIEDTNYKITEISSAYRILEKRCAPITRQLTKETNI